MQRNILILVSAVLGLLVAIISVQNGTAVTISIFGAQLALALGGITFGAFAIGLMVALIGGAGTMKLKDKISEQKQIEWQKQDNKLAKEIQSDKEQQLQAKIETLEAALKSALAKQKKTQS
ncbi:MAG: hypothetical protein K2X93_04185 [Candidatus Obscuribacterales bacterium]|nr:hypothetical protein [Candidatus Obscuribacterales bacterium]